MFSHNIFQIIRRRGDVYMSLRRLLVKNQTFCEYSVHHFKSPNLKICNSFLSAKHPFLTMSEDLQCFKKVCDSHIRVNIPAENGPLVRKVEKRSAQAVFSHFKNKDAVKSSCRNMINENLSPDKSSCGVPSLKKMKLSETQHIRVAARNYATSSDESSDTNLLSKNVRAVDQQRINQIKRMFPTPKSVLRNCFDIIAKEFNNKDLQLTSSYKLASVGDKRSWTCIYNLKWPEVVQFSHTGLTKQESSYEAATLALWWLYKSNKIDRRGTPLLFNEVSEPAHRSAHNPQNAQLTESSDTGDESLEELVKKMGEMDISSSLILRTKPIHKSFKRETNKIIKHNCLRRNKTPNVAFSRESIEEALRVYVMKSNQVPTIRTASALSRSDSVEILVLSDSDVESKEKGSLLLSPNRNDCNNPDGLEIDQVRQLFPAPKQVLFQCFDILAEEFKNGSLIISPHFKLEFANKARYWTCVYNLLWPEEMNFSYTAQRKLQASKEAATLALSWLYKNKKINDHGKPLLFGMEIQQRGAIQDEEGAQNFTNKSANARLVEPQNNLLPSLDKFTITDWENIAPKCKSSNAALIYKETNTIQPLSRRESMLDINFNDCNTPTPQNDLYNFDHFAPNINFNNSSNTSLISIRNYSTSSIDKTEKVEGESEDSISSEDEAQTVISDHQEIDQVKRFFPVPKNTLHNCFDILARELNTPTLKLTPQFKLSSVNKKISWTCIYNIKWPEEMKFSITGQTKQDSSHKAAMAALLWLYKKKKITKEGFPLLLNVKEVKQLTKHIYSTFELDLDSEDKLKEIVQLYQKNLASELVAFGSGGSEKDVKVVEELDEKWPKLDGTGGTTGRRVIKQTFRGADFYMAQEPVRLPISDYRNNILDLLQNDRIVIIKGEPGCGKSTRVPQYVLEAWAKEGIDRGACRIIVTQPRRIAAISLAERVASERQESVGDTVGFHVRLKSKFNPHTGRIMYCTTGILLRRLQSDPTLSDCNYVILDEAHERDVNTDLLMILLRRALVLNNNLKLLVMSATIDTSIFQQYLDNAPVLHIPGFTYPVKQHFLDSATKLNLDQTAKMCEGTNPFVVYEDVARVIKFIHRKRGEGAILCFLPGWEDIVKVKNLLETSGDMYVLCLHSRLQMSEQRKIFSRPPPGVRKIILSTNIAETSVTIDDVVYVVDTGIQKEQRFEIEKGVMCLDNYWISQANATQRKGRAGRVQAGECYHLYPQSKYETFPKYSIPEILRTSLTKIVLDCKVLTNNMNALAFMEQLLSPPKTSAIKQAVEELTELELLDKDENLTPLGRTVADFQLPPNLSKAMVHAVIFKCVTPVIDIATLFSAQTELFSTGLSDKERSKSKKTEFSENSDHLSIMRMFEKWLRYTEEGDTHMAERFCYDMGLVPPKLNTIGQLRQIHLSYLHNGLTDVLPISDDYSDNDELVRAVLLSGVGTLLHHRSWDVIKGRVKKSNTFLTGKNHKATIASESVNFKKTTFSSNYLLYINEMMSNIRRTTVVRETSVVSPLSVLLFKNNKLIIEEVKKEDYSEKLQSQDQVLLKLEGTKIELLCDRENAITILKCKEALQAGLQYYIFHLTQGNQFNPAVNKQWDKILIVLNEALRLQNYNN